MNHYQRLRDLREDKDLTQKDIAKLLHSTQASYSAYELGKRMLTIDRYITLARFYNVSLDYLTGITNKLTPLPKE